MGTGIVVHAVIMFVSALVERRRLAAAREHGVVESGGQVPLSIFILMPQFILMGIADAFVEVTKIEFFYDQVHLLRRGYKDGTKGIRPFGKPKSKP